MPSHMNAKKQQSGTVTSCQQYVTFSIGDELFGIDVIKAQEVLNLSEITKVPNTVNFMKGVIDLRGTIIPLIDMRIKFNIPEKPYDQKNVIIIAEIRNLLCGLIVDSVSDVINMRHEEIENTPHFSSEINRDSVTGIGRCGNRLIIILDADRILTEEDIHQIKTG